MYESIMEKWMAFWQTVGDFLFYPYGDGISGYMDGPRSLFFMIMISVFGAFIFYRIYTRKYRRLKKGIIRRMVYRTIHYNLRYEEVVNQTKSMYVRYFDEYDLYDVEQIVSEIMYRVVEKTFETLH